MKWDQIDPDLLAIARENRFDQVPADWVIPANEPDASSARKKSVWLKRFAVRLAIELVVLLLMGGISASLIRYTVAGLAFVQGAQVTQLKTESLLERSLSVALTETKQKLIDRQAKLDQLASEINQLKSVIAAKEPGAWPPDRLTLSGTNKSKNPDIPENSEFKVELTRTYDGDYVGELLASNVAGKKNYMVRAFLDGQLPNPTLSILNKLTGETIFRDRGMPPEPLDLPPHSATMLSVLFSLKPLMLNLDRHNFKFSGETEVFILSGTFLENRKQ